MSERGPSAYEIAQAVREQQLVSGMRLEPDSKWIREFEQRRSVESRIGLSILFLGLSSLAIVFLFFIDWDAQFGALVGSVLLSVFLITIAGAGFAVACFSGLDRKSSDVLNDYERFRSDQEAGMAKTIKRISDELDLYKLGATYIVKSGGVLIQGNVIQSAVILGNVTNSVINVGNQSEVAKALAALAAKVNESENPQAGEFYTDLNDAIEEGRPSKIKSAWNSLVEVLPAIADIAEIADTIIGLFK